MVSHRTNVRRSLCGPGLVLRFVCMLGVALNVTSATGQSIGVYADPACESCEIALPLGSPTTFWIAAETDGAVPGITSAEFLIEGLPPLPEMLVLSVISLPPSNLSFGDPFTPPGAMLVWADDCLSDCVPLYEVQVLPFAPVEDVTLSVVAMDPPSDPSFPCPSVFDCDIWPMCVAGGQAILNPTFPGFFDCLLGEIGACCDRQALSCVDGVSESDCQPPLEWTWGVTCDALDPPCAPAGPGTIIVEKQTDPDGASDQFEFLGDASGFIGDGEQIVVSGLDPGTYTSMELVPAGWELSSIVCDDGNSTGDVNTSTATFQLEGGETVKCTFTNVRQLGQISIHKAAEDDSGQVFQFEGDLGPLSLQAGAGMLYVGFPVGDYTVTEIVPDGWALTGVVCWGSNNTLLANGVTIHLGAGDQAGCTFTNEAIPSGTIIVEKQTDPDDAPDPFTFAGDVAGSIRDDEQIVVAGLTPGTYTSQELLPAGWHLTAIVCDDDNSSGDVNTGTATFQLEAGETVKCTFRNFLPRGACCDRANLVCVDDVSQLDCPPPLEWTEEVLCADLDPPCTRQVRRVDTTTKGSLLIFPKVEIKWNAAGQIVQDTFLDLTNDYPEDVFVHWYFINGDAPLEAVYVSDPPVLVEPAHDGWNWVNCSGKLTNDEPTYMSAATGLPDGCQPFTILDDGGRPDPEGPPGSRVLRGYAIVFAVDSLGNEIRWNHLKGDAVIVNYARATAWEYSAFAFQAITAARGMATDGTPGQLLLDGYEYAIPFDKLLLDFYAVGSDALSGDMVTVSVDTDLTLFPVDLDVRQDGEPPIITKAHFDIWNMEERMFSGTTRCITCWDQTMLSAYDPPNHFMVGNLQTDKGKARIDGMASTVCGLESVDAALLGVAAKMLAFSGAGGGFSTSGTALVGQGEQAATILFDLTEPPGELNVTGVGGSRISGSPQSPVKPRRK